MTQPVSQRPRNDTRRLLDNQRSEVVIADMGSGTTTVIYDSNQLIEAPNWSADGKWLVFNADGRLFRLSPDGLEGPHRILTAPIENANNDHVLSFDGTQMAISDHDEEDNNDSAIYTLPVEGSSEPFRVTKKGMGASYLHGWSTDSKELLFTGNRNDQYDIYSVNIETGHETQLTNTPGLDDGPEYDPQGKFIYFNSNRVIVKRANIFPRRYSCI